MVIMSIFIMKEDFVINLSYGYVFSIWSCYVEVMNYDFSVEFVQLIYNIFGRDLLRHHVGIMVRIF